MFDDLVEAWREMLKNCTHITDSNGVHISFPEKIFNNFEQEFNICFVEPENDILFQNWRNSDNGDEYDEGRF